MTLRLTIEHSPHPQDRREMHHPGGEFSIGRGAECSWQLNDPDMYVSRKHCVITGEAGQFIVTDASRGGLFIDGKDQPLGPGNAARLEPGMRLRLGDTVIRVEFEAPAPIAAPRTQTPAQRQMTHDDFFSQPVTPPPPVQRPQDLPQPFDTGPTDARRYDTTPDRAAPPPLFDDPSRWIALSRPARAAAFPSLSRPAKTISALGPSSTKRRNPALPTCHPRPNPSQNPQATTGGPCRPPSPRRTRCPLRCPSLLDPLHLRPNPCAWFRKRLPRPALPTRKTAPASAANRPRRRFPPSLPQPPPP